MSKAKNATQVQSACRDCALCTGTRLTGVGRNLQRTGQNIKTLGVASLTRATCRLCGHPMSEHADYAKRQQDAAAQPRWVNQGVVDGKYLYRWWTGSEWSKHTTDDGNAPPPQEVPAQWTRQEDGRYRWWDGDLWTNDFTEQADAEPPTATPARWVMVAAGQYRWWATNRWSENYSAEYPAAVPADLRFASASSTAAAVAAPATEGPAEQIAKLAALHQQGILSDDEFAAGKARVLGLA